MAEEANSPTTANARFAMALRPMPVAVGVACAAVVGVPAVGLSWLPLWVVLFHLVSVTLWVTLMIALHSAPGKAPRRVGLTWVLPSLMLSFVLVVHWFDRNDYQLWLISTLVLVEVADWAYREYIST